MLQQLFSIKETMRILSIGKTKLYDLFNKEELELVKIGRRSFVPRVSVRSYIQRLRGKNTTKGDDPRWALPPPDED